MSPRPRTKSSRSIKPMVKDKASGTRHGRSRGETTRPKVSSSDLTSLSLGVRYHRNTSTNQPDRDADNASKVNIFVRRHRFVYKSTESFTTSERRAFERNVYDYARSIGFDTTGAREEVSKARKICGAKDDEDYNSSLENEVNDSEAILRKITPQCDDTTSDRMPKASSQPSTEEAGSTPKRARTTRHASDYFAADHKSSEDRGPTARKKKRKRRGSDPAEDQALSEGETCREAFLDSNGGIRKREKKKKKKAKQATVQSENDTVSQEITAVASQAIEDQEEQTPQEGFKSARSPKSKKSKQKKSKKKKDLDNQPRDCAPSIPKDSVSGSMKVPKPQVPQNSITADKCSTNIQAPSPGASKSTTTVNNSSKTLKKKKTKKDLKIVLREDANGKSPLRPDTVSKAPEENAQLTSSMQGSMTSSKSMKPPRRVLSRVPSSITKRQEAEEKKKASDAKLQWYKEVLRLKSASEKADSGSSSSIDSSTDSEAEDLISGTNAAKAMRDTTQPVFGINSEEILQQPDCDAQERVGHTPDLRSHNQNLSKEHGQDVIQLSGHDNSYTRRMPRQDFQDPMIQSVTAADEEMSNCYKAGNLVGFEQNLRILLSSENDRPEPGQRAQVMSKYEAISTIEKDTRDNELAEQNDLSDSAGSITLFTPIADILSCPSTPKQTRQEQRCDKKGFNQFRETETEQYGSPPRTPRRKTTAHSSPFFDRSVAAKISSLKFPSLDSKKFGLVQERLADQPFRLLVAVTLLNKTRGSVSIPVCDKLFETYPTTESIAAADVCDVMALIQSLGLHNKRASFIVNLAKAWLRCPPRKGERYRRLNYPSKNDGKDVLASEEPLSDEDPRAAWEVAHLAGMGDYAIDSWRIFCRDVLRGVPTGLKPRDDPREVEQELQQEWTRVLPRDKELRAYLRWRWLRLGYLWNSVTGDKISVPAKIISQMETGEIRSYQGYKNPWLADIFFREEEIATSPVSIRSIKMEREMSVMLASSPLRQPSRGSEGRMDRACLDADEEIHSDGELKVEASEVGEAVNEALALLSADLEIFQFRGPR